MKLESSRWTGVRIWTSASASTSATRAALGRQHTGRRYDEFHRQDELQRFHQRLAYDRALHASRSRHDQLRSHIRRSNNLDETLDGRNSLEEEPGPDFRVRLSRGKLRNDGYPEWRPRRREGIALKRALPLFGRTRAKRSGQHEVRFERNNNPVPAVRSSR